MGFGSFAAYSVLAVARRGLRSVSYLAGIILSVAMVAGTSISVDSSSVPMLLSATRDIPVDFVAVKSTVPYHFNESVFEPAIARLNNVENVDDVTVLVRLGYSGWWGGWAVGTQDGTMLPAWNDLVFLPLASEALMSHLGIVGEMPEPGKVAISKHMAWQLGVGIGDWVVCSYELADEECFNLNFQVSRVWEQSRDFGRDVSAGGVYIRHSYAKEWTGPGSTWEVEEVYFDPVVLNMADASYVIEMIESFSQIDNPMSLDVLYYVWLDRAAVFREGNPDLSIDRLKGLGIALDDAGEPFGLQFHPSALSIPLRSGEADTAWTRMIFLGLSLPVVVIGVYISLVGIDLGVTERRLELATLRARGASVSQVRGSLLLECAVLGFIGGLIGLVLGIIVSRLFVPWATRTLTGGVSGFSATELLVSPLSVSLAIVFGISLMVISAYSPVKRASGLPISEALHIHAASEEQLEYRPKLDIVMLALVALSVASIIVVRIGLEYSSTVSLSANMVLYLLWGLGVVMTPIVPFLLSFATVRLLTRGTRKLYPVFAPAVRPWTGEMHPIVDNNIRRSSRKASNLCLIMSLTLAFGIFVSTAMESTISHEAAVLEYNTGADIKVEAWSSYNVDFAVLERARNIPGVDGVCSYFAVTLDDGVWVVGGFGNTAVVDTEAYADVIRYHGRSFNDERETLHLLQRNGTVLVREEYTRLLGVGVGQVVSIPFVYRAMIARVPLQLEVVGTFDALPGFSDRVKYLVDRSTLGFVPDNLLQPGFGLFMDLEEGCNVHDVANETYYLFADAGFIMDGGGYMMTVLEDKLNALNQDPKYGSLKGFLYNEYGLLLVTMTVGIGLMILISASDRRRELASIMARGASAAQMRRILLGETTVLMIFSVVLGVLCGLASGYLFNAAMQTADERGVPVDFVLSTATALFPLLAIVSFVASSVAVAHRTGRMRLAEVLKIRGG